MAAGRDEANFGFTIDAPASISTTFYALIGDNFYTNSSSASDVDAYFIITSPGTNYSVLSIDNSVVGNTFINLYSSDGVLLMSSNDGGEYSSIQFTATQSKYIIALSSQFPGTYGARFYNNNVTENNAIGEIINYGKSYSGAIDYVSDSDHFTFPVIAGTQYNISVISNVTDLFVKATYVYTISSTGYLPLTAVSSGASSYAYTAPESGIAEISLSSNSFVRTGSYSLSVTATDDYPNSSGTSGMVVVNGASSIGTIGIGGDLDLFRVQLTAGTSYVFNLDNVLGDLDPFLRLRRILMHE